MPACMRVCVESRLRDFWPSKIAVASIAEGDLTRSERCWSIVPVPGEG